MKNITAGNLNKAIARISAAGLDAFTDLKLIQQENPRLVRAHGRAQSGKIMSYNESAAYQKAMQAKNPNIKVWSREDYSKALREFYMENAERFTVTGAKAEFYSKAIDVFDRAGIEYDAKDVRRISIEDLRKIFENAQEQSANYKDSWAFYEFLADELDNYYGQGVL